MDSHALWRIFIGLRNSSSGTSRLAGDVAYNHVWAHGSLARNRSAWPWCSVDRRR